MKIEYRLVMGVDDPREGAQYGHWARFHRDSFDNAGRWIKSELAIFIPDGEAIRLEWKQFHGFQSLTEIAPINQFLLKL